MSDEPFNVVLELLGAIRADTPDLRETLRERGYRLTSLEIAVSSFAATEMSHYANTALRVDRLEERLLRIERRSDLIAA
jgi:hypothetical protein